MRRTIELFDGIPGVVLRNELLAGHTTFRIGGRADFFIEPRDDESLREVLRRARGGRLRTYCLGAGSNVLVRDRGVRAAVIHLGAAYFNRIGISGRSLACGAGVYVHRLLSVAAKAGLGSLEFLAGIPGTLGGALVMNAGARGKSIGDYVEVVWVMDYNGMSRELSAQECGFVYRGSALDGCVVLGARLRLTRASPRAAADKLRQNAALKRQTQDYSAPSAGCVFKNPDGEAAGRLIDICGLKGRSIGGARISSRHANFIVNQGGARAADVTRLMAVIKRTVKRIHNVELQPEIRIW